MDAEQFSFFGYPFTGDGSERPLLALWVLFLVGFLVPPVTPVTVIPLAGYLVRVLVASERGEAAPTFLTDGWTLVHRGFGAVIISVAYLGVPIAALAATVYGATTTAATAEAVPVVMLYAGSTAVLVLFLLGGYLVPIALIAYGRETSLRAAFDPSTLLTIGLHAAYFPRWVAGMLTLALAASVANLISGVPRVGPVIAALSLAYGVVLACHVWGRAAGVARTRRR